MNNGGFLGATGDTDKRGAKRRKGVLEAAQRHGLPDVVLIDGGPAPVSMSNGASAVRAQIESIRELDALVCVSDPVAFGAIMALQRMGLDIPGDIAVTGFGAFEIASISNPSLTTVNVWADQIGERTGKLIEALLNGELASRANVMTTLESVLVQGDST